ncbi:hypothetical protein PHAVU_011G144700 [Phaseolus vulgaris]|uniref:DEAD-box RNA helicase Q domain-containing protein n=1 Tax=Phaseolus vulgaris TaxID=3885 RepID=V7AHB6_PHAVU|nr:hypothetical protein PHAVU_011G144700g [Phaseolus vulgaris]ESW05017.1 hypothetical protein PHAVU_011G144700g [Phaseolus vulgaris]
MITTSKPNPHPQTSHLNSTARPTSQTPPPSPRLRPLCFVSAAPETADATHSLLLERLRARQLRDAARVAPEPRKKARAAAVAEAEKERAKKEKVVASFEELGVSEEVMEAVREMGIEVPTEI